MAGKLCAVVAAGATTLALVACSTSEAGVPRAAETVVPSTGESESEPPTTSADAPPLDGVEPCELLSASDVAELGVSPGKDADLLGDPGCDWSKQNDFGFSIGLRPELSFGDFNLRGSTPTPVSVGAREAYQVENLGGSGGACDLFLVTSGSSFVQVTATASGARDTAKACGVAARVATMIDPRLP